MKIPTHLSAACSPSRPALGAFAVLAMTALTVYAPAQQSSLEACQAIESDIERLQCYDNLGQSDDRASSSGESPSSAGKAPGTAGSDSAATRPSGEPDTRPTPASSGIGAVEAGSDGNQSRGDGSSVTRNHVVASARYNQFTGWTIEFENGQVWRQVGSDEYNIESGKTYSLSPAFGDTFFLGKNENNRKIRVKRAE